MSRYDHTAESLANVFCNRLRATCNKHRSTNFIFNSVLLTEFQWLNGHIDRFNGYMYDLCSEIPNLHYFDSDNLLAEAKLKNVYVPKNKGGNGIHISFEARRLVVKRLPDCVRSLATHIASGIRLTRHPGRG